MIEKIHHIQHVKLSRDEKVIVKVSANVEFTCPEYSSGDQWYKLENVKGDFDITKVTRNYLDGDEPDSDFNNSEKSYRYDTQYYSQHIFYITENIHMTEICAVTHHLQVPDVCLKALSLYEYFKSDIVLPGYGDLKFTCYAKKMIESTEDDIELVIENPYENVKIQGSTGDYKVRQSSTENVDLQLLFVFAPDVLKQLSPNSASESLTNDESDSDSNVSQSTQASSINESSSLLQKVLSNDRFADIFFVASDGTLIPGHCCILAEVSSVIAKFIDDTTETPILIDAKRFSAETIQAGLSYVYGNPDAINGKEVDTFKFAVEYRIDSLFETCLPFIEKAVDPSNVCEFMTIAYQNNFEGLKEKCLEILVQKRD